MILPNPILKVHHGKEGPARAAAMLGRSGKRAAQCLADLSNSADRGALSYIWVAIELGYNIMVFGTNAADVENFADAISAFVPPHKSVIDLRDGKQFDERTNFMGVIHTRRIFRQRNCEIAEKYMPDYLIVPEGERGRLDDYFALAKHGVSFIAPAVGNFTDRSIVKMLTSGQFKVKASNVHMLDMSVFVESNQNACIIKTVTEYRWLCRGETVKYDKHQLVKYENIHVVSNGKINEHNLAKSKLAGKYSHLFLFSTQEAVEELDKRAEFLGSINSTISNCGTKHAVEMYYEIK